MKPTIVAVTGGSGSGKTTIVNAIKSRFGADDILTIEQDHYYKDQSHLSSAERDNVNFDEPAAIDLNLIADHLASLKNGHPIERPTYDFKSHTRTGQNVILDPKPIIFFDGIFALSDARVRKNFALSIYVDVADDLRFIRRLKRDTAERGRTVEGVIEQYLRSVKPMHDLHIAPLRKLADIVISWDSFHDRTIEMLASMLRR